MPPKQKPPTPPSTTQQLAEVLASAAKGIENITTLNPELKEPPHTPSVPTPPSLLDDVKSIKATLAVLQKVITPSVQADKPLQSKIPENAPSAPPPSRAKGKTPPAMFASAAASSPCPSIVVSLDHLNWSTGKLSLADLCCGINQAMEASNNNQVCISAARWTVRENMILTGGPNTTAHHLQRATHIIRHHLSKTYTLPPLTIRPNVKWSKLLINSVPTGVITDSRAKTPDQCHAALTSDNPSYAALTITRKPTWV
ncbi:hypothetical protein EI94DRAFT_1811792 [Lactarius quietus]|nr:hypothetical protein EI94DRAFT_1811792 [Lactarius quietus]